MKIFLLQNHISLIVFISCINIIVSVINSSLCFHDYFSNIVTSEQSNESIWHVVKPFNNMLTVFQLALIEINKTFQKTSRNLQKQLL